MVKTLPTLLPAAICALLVVTPTRSVAQSGGDIFRDVCAECHSGAQSGRTPTRFSLSQLTPRAIAEALGPGGVMRSEGAELTESQRILIGEYLTGQTYSEERLPSHAYCAGTVRPRLDPDAISWMGFGGDLEGTGFQSGDRAGISIDEVPRLELLWAFGFPDASQVRTKPTIVGDVAIVADQFGTVYALHARSGCVQWTFEAEAGVRGGVLIGEDERGRTVAYIVDARATAYALDTESGEVLWKTRVGWHPESNNTGHAVLHDNRLIVPISTMGEVVAAGDPSYECCTSSGAVAALDTSTGDLLWYHRIIPEAPERAGTNAAGTPRWAPSGAPVWSSPTLDTKRGLVYVGSGENLSRPTTATSDAILAIDWETGDLDWIFQATAEDAFTMACSARRNRENCPSPPGPDVDFGMAPILVERRDGREILVVGQKSGTVWALDPDNQGNVLWSSQIGRGGALGGIHWGMATDGRLVYAANADRQAEIVNINPGMDWAPGLFALDLMDGTVVWSAPAPDDTCADRPGCWRANSAAPTVIPGVVFAGGLDGYMRAHATDDGRLLWEFDTVRRFETVNGIPGTGGAIDGPGPVVAGGLVFVNSGYATFGQMPGNVLLVFGLPSDTP